MHVLVVEDEKKVAAIVRDGLEEEGWQVDVCPRGDEAVAQAGRQNYDAIVLDIMLPGRDGLTILRQLREARNPVAVVLLTARGDLDERVVGLNLGADDYLAKPFSVLELVARLKAVRRRREGAAPSRVTHAGVTLDLHSREAWRGIRKIELTNREFALLECLLRAPGRVFTRAELCEKIWGYRFDTQSNFMDVAVQRLRRKLDDGEATPLIQTVRSVGYTLWDGL
jgi:DNA-binding response OmpR family regulator